MLACGWSLWADHVPPAAAPAFEIRAGRPAAGAPARPAAPATVPVETAVEERLAIPEEEGDASAWTVEPEPVLDPAEFEALERFVWPEPPPEEAALPLPGLLEDPLFTHDFLRQVRSVTAPSPVLDFMNDVLSGPQLLLDTGAELLLQWIPRPEPVLRSDDGRPVVFRLLDLRVTPGDAPIFTSFLHAWIVREQGFFAGFAESEMNTVAFEDGTGDVNEDPFRDKQRKLISDTLRRSYLAKYQIEGRETIRKDGFGLSEWKGIDYVLLPPAAAAYLYYRGFDQHVTAGDFRVNLGVDPIANWIGFNRDLVAGLTVEITVKDFPIGLMAAFGVADDEFRMDFIGVGTGIDMMIKALALREESAP